MTLSDELPEDVEVLQSALNTDSSEINVGMAGTAMRFLTTYYSMQEGETVFLTGAERMKKRPVRELVNALQLLGAEIEYLEREGFPPLKIVGKKLAGGEVNIYASVSSQFISALMMVAPRMKNGLTILLEGKVLSRPYIELTANCMRQCGIAVRFERNMIKIPAGDYQMPNLKIESDWSAASYFYAIAAARPRSKFLLKGLQLGSPQGDSVVAKWFAEIGVASTQKKEGVEIQSQDKVKLPAEIDFTDNPDLAQTFAFLAAALGQPLKLMGLDNLRLKETDRVAAMQTELEKLGVTVSLEGNEMKISGKVSVEKANIKTYNDHRMAMSAAVLASQIPIEIESPEVVAKSFPSFWSALSF
jgi:3-phosphoshikimate 1-carboxyvinyltransferase